MAEFSRSGAEDTAAARIRRRQGYAGGEDMPAARIRRQRYGGGKDMPGLKNIALGIKNEK